ncbi:MAG TPA: glycosyltransferase, partial [Pyrinomonadaceae bacterium]
MSASLSVVIPAYNEAARLGNTLTAVVNYLRQSWPDAELIVVDDGSTDNTASLAREVLNDSGGIHITGGGAHDTGGGLHDTGGGNSGRGLRTSVITYKSNLGKGRAVRLGLLAARGEVALFSDVDLSTPITETPKL